MGLIVFCIQVGTLLSPMFWHIDASAEAFLQANSEEKRLVFVESPVRARLPVARLLARRGFPREELPMVIQMDSIDYDEFFSKLDACGNDQTKLRACVALFEERNQQNIPQKYSVNGWEVVRLNQPNLSSAKRILALDLGDEPNANLMKAFPSYEPFLLHRLGDKFLLKPMQPAGVKLFNP